MRCRDAKQWLCAQRDGDGEVPSQGHESETLQQHLARCASCRAFEQELGRLEVAFRPSTPPVVPSSISTNNIMLAIKQHQCVAQQLEDIRKQQQSRVARLRRVGTLFAALVFLALGSIPLLFVAIAITQSDLIVMALTPLNGIIDLVVILAQYLLLGLTLVTRDNWLLSGVAFAVVVMMGMWLRLMRYPQEA